MQDAELYIRIKQALVWLKRNKGMLQKDIAGKMAMTEESFTRGLSRIKEKRDDDFVIKLHSAISDYISLDYLLNGNGDMLIQEQAEKTKIQSASSTPLSHTDKLIASLEKQIKDKDTQLADKDRIIRLLEQKIEVLEAMQHIDANSPLKEYPFKIGTAEPNL